MSGLLEPFRLGEKAPAGHSWSPKTAQPFAATSVYDRCVEAAAELPSSSTIERNKDTSVNAACMAVRILISCGFEYFLLLKRSKVQRGKVITSGGVDVAGE